MVVLRLGGRVSTASRIFFFLFVASQKWMFIYSQRHLLLRKINIFIPGNCKPIPPAHFFHPPPTFKWPPNSSRAHLSSPAESTTLRGTRPDWLLFHFFSVSPPTNPWDGQVVSRYTPIALEPCGATSAFSYICYWLIDYLLIPLMHPLWCGALHWTTTSTNSGVSHIVPLPRHPRSAAESLFSHTHIHTIIYFAFTQYNIL